MAETAINSSNLVRTTFEWGRIQQPSDWFLPLATTALIVAYVIWMYRRDCVNLSRWVTVPLAALRIVTFLGLLLVYLEPQWRTERDVVRNSRAAVLIDTSLSMGLNDETSDSAAAGPTRLEQVRERLEQGSLLSDLRKRHDVSIWRFDQDLNRIGLLNKQTTGESEKPAAQEKPAAPQQPAATETTNDPTAPQDTAKASKNDWPEELTARGAETRLGQALRQLIQEEATDPLAGVILISDGGQNAGPQPSAAVALASELHVPIATIGVGSDRQPVNVRIADLLVPARAFPGDSYTVTAFIQAQGLTGQEVAVELLSRPADTDESQPTDSRREATQQVRLGRDGETVPVKFEIVPQEIGRRVIELRIDAPPGDGIRTDNSQSADIEVVEHKNHVLLLAGGPTREYQFVRNQLNRDRDVVLDVLLQTAQDGVSQEAHAILTEFPPRREDLAEFDCIIAFDPDWTLLDAAKIGMLDNWVGEEAGGLIVVAGPIQTPRWSRESALAKLRDLYPVDLPDRFSSVDDSVGESGQAEPLKFTREGEQADFLWLGDSAAVGAQAWARFPGVFGPYPVRRAKSGATVYAHVGDGPGGDDQPIYWAEQFYGSGRVFFQASGEMWRMRRLRENYFDEFYIKLVRHVTQGRLLRGSNRGVLLVERERYLLGQTVLVRAQLRDARQEPLDLPDVELEVLGPDGSLQSVTMRVDPVREGNYSGQFTARQEGAYRMELALPDGEGARLVRRVQVRVPELEREDPRRNDALLQQIAEATSARYYLGFDAAGGATGQTPLVDLLPDRTKTTVLAGEPIRLWDNVWTLVALCSLLSLEWLIRRLVKLA